MVTFWLLFPVIAWYDIIIYGSTDRTDMLLFPVIAWYDIIVGKDFIRIALLLFPVIAWYDIIDYIILRCCGCCCSQLSLGMI